MTQHRTAVMSHFECSVGVQCKHGLPLLPKDSVLWHARWNSKQRLVHVREAGQLAEDMVYMPSCEPSCRAVPT